MASIKLIDGKKGKTYHLIYSHIEYGENGNKKYKTKWLTAGKTKAEATEFLRQFNKEYKSNRDSFNKKESRKFNDFVYEEFLPWSEVNKSESTHSITKMCLDRFVNYFGNIYIEDINYKLIEQFMIWRKQKVSNRTVNIDLTYLSQCLKKAVQYRYITENPVNQIQKLKEAEGKLRYLSVEEIQKLNSVANPYIERLIAVGLMTGMRLSEILSIKIENIDFKQNVIRLVNDDDFNTKNRKNREIPMPEQLQSKMKEYISTWVNYPHIEVQPRTPEQNIFLFCDKFGNKIKSFRKAFMRLLRECDIKDATIHTMRHTYASHLVMKGVNLRVIQELLGHHSIRVTEKYAHLSDGHKQEAVRMLSY